MYTLAPFSLHFQELMFLPGLKKKNWLIVVCVSSATQDLGTVSHQTDGMWGTGFSGP